jgi:hypothetical protein
VEKNEAIMAWSDNDHQNGKGPIMKRTWDQFDAEADNEGRHVKSRKTLSDKKWNFEEVLPLRRNDLQQIETEKPGVIGLCNGRA